LRGASYPEGKLSWKLWLEASKQNTRDENQEADKQSFEAVRGDNWNCDVCIVNEERANREHYSKEKRKLGWRREVHALIDPQGASPSATLMAADHWRYNCTCARTDRGADRSANKSARQSAGSTARQFLLRQSAARGHERESCGNDNCKRLHARISP
jgi:hypothetical protein